MIWGKKFKAAAATSRLIDEELYARAFNEIEQGIRRDGLWAKALANGEGEQARAKALYIQYRVQSFKDELMVLEQHIENGRRTSQKVSGSQWQKPIDEDYEPELSENRNADFLIRELEAAGFIVENAGSERWSIRKPGKNLVEYLIGVESMTIYVKRLRGS